MAEQAVTVADLDELLTFLGPAEICVLLQYFARYLRSTRSVETLVNSTARIFDLISAIKAYSYMDRAPILEVDVPAGLDATLQMLQSRIGKVQVIRDYAPDLPTISAYGGELNQVWTALIENALEAIAESEAAGAEGQLRISARLEADMLLVEIWDSGPGIRPELQDRIFEPFFTTKPPGQGLGLGLDNAMRIVRKHRGHMERPLRARQHLLSRPPAAGSTAGLLSAAREQKDGGRKPPSLSSPWSLVPGPWSRFSVPGPGNSRPQFHFPGCDRQLGRCQFRAFPAFFHRLNADLAGFPVCLHDDLRQAVEERALGLLVALLAVGIAVAHADERAVAGDLESDQVARRWHRRGLPCRAPPP